MVEQWKSRTSDGGIVAKRWWNSKPSAGGSLEHLIVEHWNISWWNIKTSDNGTVDHLMVEQWNI